MAVVTRSQSKAAQEGQVSTCVANLIQAFVDGLNIFKRVRERRRKRKARKQEPDVERVTGAELQLSDSLKRGPYELAERYAQCYGAVGERFAWGDSVAHASLAETLIRLNTGLVGIITSFLNHDTHKGKSALNLDYQSLTCLSDDSRRNALRSMDQLFHRLSRPQFQMRSIAPPPACSSCGSSKHNECEAQTGKEKKRRASSKQRSPVPTVTRMPSKSSSHSQLVMVRPKNLKKGNSTSSSRSSKASSRSSPASTPNTSPLSSPVQKYIAMAPLQPQPIGCLINGPLAGKVERQRVDSFDTLRPQYQYSLSPAPEHIHHPTPKLPTFTPTSRKPSTQSSPHRAKHHSSSPSPSPSSSAPPPPPPSPPSPPTPLPATAPFKRRLDKPTPSAYTFASDSTKLGEIPQRHWTKPWDEEEAERLNSEATLTRQTTTEGSGEERTRTKKGLRRFLRRGSGEPV